MRLDLSPRAARETAVNPHELQRQSDPEPTLVRHTG
jgi:hypothetical protein